MDRRTLVQNIHQKRSLLCVGLDPDREKIPPHLSGRESGIRDFLVDIIDATAEHCVAFKPNLAFFEGEGERGWSDFFYICNYIRDKYPEHFLIADAKRGDIGNTSKQYAQAFLQKAKCHAITVAPYMGRDSVEPFLVDGWGWAIVLALTSNPGAFDFQTLTLSSGDRLFEHVLKVSKDWGDSGNMMYVVGATKAEYLMDIRKILPDHFLLVPGVGAQGGDLDSVIQHGKNADMGLLINSSRGIIYAGSGEDFADKAKRAASDIHHMMMAHFI